MWRRNANHQSIQMSNIDFWEQESSFRSKCVVSINTSRICAKRSFRFEVLCWVSQIDKSGCNGKLPLRKGRDSSRSLLRLVEQERRAPSQKVLWVDLDGLKHGAQSRMVFPLVTLVSHIPEKSSSLENYCRDSIPQTPLLTCRSAFGDFCVKDGWDVRFIVQPEFPLDMMAILQIDRC